MYQKVESLNSEDATLRRGFCATPTANGGWVVTNIPGAGYMPMPIGAFTNDNDLIDFVIAELEPKPRITVDSCMTSEELEKHIAALSRSQPDGE